MEIITPNYQAFRLFIDKLIGGGAVVFFGNDERHANEIIVYATDKNNVTVIFESAHGLPEDFHNNFPTATAVPEISRVKWKG